MTGFVLIQCQRPQHQIQVVVQGTGDINCCAERSVDTGELIAVELVFSVEADGGVPKEVLGSISEHNLRSRSPQDG